MRTQRGRTRRNIESAPRPGLEPRGSASVRTAHLRESAPAPTIPAEAHPRRLSLRKRIRPHRPSSRKRARPRLDPRESASARTAGRILPTREKGARKLGLPHYLVWPNSLYRSRCPDSHQPPYLYWLSCLRKKSKRGGSSWMRWAPASISMAGHSSSLESKS